MSRELLNGFGMAVLDEMGSSRPWKYNAHLAAQGAPFNCCEFYIDNDDAPAHTVGGYKLRWQIAVLYDLGNDRLSLQYVKQGRWQHNDQDSFTVNPSDPNAIREVAWWVKWWTEAEYGPSLPESLE